MKKNMKFKNCTFLLLLVLFFFGSQVNVYATETNKEVGSEEIIFPVHEFETYEEFVEFKKLNNEGGPSLFANYYFGQTTFSNFVWVKGGAGFYNLNYFDIEKHNRNRIALEVYDMNDNYYGKGVTAAAVNWVSVDFGALLPRGKSYKVKMVNLDSGTANVFQGVVNYN